MQPIIAQPGRHAHPNPDAAARQRRDRLAKATADQMESALALLSMIDPEAFEIAFTAVTTDETSPRTTRPSPCAASAAPWSASSLTAACSGSTSAATAPRPARQEIYDPGHAAEVTWILPDEDPEEL